MLSLHDISAWIEVDGKELKEYGVEVDHAQSQVTCWIASQVGKNFSVVFEDNAEYREHSLCSSLHLDGSSVGGKLIRPGFGNFPDPRVVVQSAQVISANSSRPFEFSKLELTDDDDYLNQASSHLGEICIRIRRGQTVDSVPFERGSIASGHGKIHERSKKAVSHCVSYGEEVKTAPQSMWRVRYLDDNIPLARFVFKYRDSSLLQANGIMPRPPPTKKKAAIGNEVLDLTTNDHVKPEPLDEDVEIVDGPTQQRAAGPSKRRKTTLEIQARPNKKIKRERHAILSGEIIDLT